MNDNEIELIKEKYKDLIDKAMMLKSELSNNNYDEEFVKK